MSHAVACASRRLAVAPPLRHMPRMEHGTEIRLNGEARRVTAATVAELLGQIGLAARKVAVERNREIVPRSQYGETPVAPGDAIEIVHFIGGG